MAGDKDQALLLLSKRFNHVGRESVEMIASAAWDAAIEAAAKIAEHPYRIGQVDGSTKPTETGEAIAIEIRYLAGRKP